MDKNVTNWVEIYSNNKAGSYLNYPSENMVTLFFNNIKYINLNGKCLDYGFGPANNTEFLIQHMSEMHGIEVSECCISIAKKRLAKFEKFRLENFLVKGSEGDLTSYFDLIVAWQMLYYNDKLGLSKTIAMLHKWLKPGGVLLCTLITPKDVKVKNAKKIDEDTYVIDGRIPHQEGCKVFSAKNEQEFLAFFDQFSILDYGYYERASSILENTASEYYLVAMK